MWEDLSVFGQKLKSSHVFPEWLTVLPGRVPRSAYTEDNGQGLMNKSSFILGENMTAVP